MHSTKSCGGEHISLVAVTFWWIEHVVTIILCVPLEKKNAAESLVHTKLSEEHNQNATESGQDVIKMLQTSLDICCHAL